MEVRLIGVGLYAEFLLVRKPYTVFIKLDDYKSLKNVAYVG